MTFRRCSVSVTLTLLFVSRLAIAGEFTAEDLVVNPLSIDSTQAVLPDLDAVQLLFVGESPHYSAEVLGFLKEYLFPVLASSDSWVYMPETSHAHGVVLDAYVVGDLLEDEFPETIRLMSGAFYGDIRRLNAEASNQIRVAAVDVNHFPWAFREAVSLLKLEPLLDYVGVDVLSAQFGAGRPPTLPEAFVDRSQVARAHVDWARSEHPHLDRYIESLRSASTEIERTRSQLVTLWGEVRIETLLELLHYEALSATYRQSSRHAFRERTMVDLARHGLSKFGLPGIAHVGGFHAERAYTHIFGNFLDGSRMAEVLARELNTFHIIFYGLAGERLQSYMDESSITFDNRRVYPAGNLMTLVGTLVTVPSFVDFQHLDEGTRAAFGFHEISPALHWDLLVVFPTVTIRPTLQ